MKAKRLLKSVPLAMVAVTAVVLSLGAAVGTASEAYDQAQAGPPAAGLPPRALTMVAQTFTAGRSGMLTQVDLMLDNNGVTSRSLVVEVQAVAHGVPSGKPLSIASLTSGDVPSAYPWGSWISVYMSAPVVAGREYSIVISDTTAAPFGGSQYLWSGAPGDPYPRGEALLTYDFEEGRTWHPQPGLDLAFRTYVRASGKPVCVVTNERTGIRFRVLQAAVDLAAAGDLLTIKGTCVGTSTIDKSLALEGHGTSALGAATLDGRGIGPVLTVNEGASVEASALMITGGSATSPPASSGGGILNLGTLTLIRSTVSGNAAVSGGGIQNGGVFGEAGTLAVVDSTVTDNVATALGGGLQNMRGFVTLSGTTVRDNRSEFLGGGIFSSATMRLFHSAVLGNTSGNAGGIGSQGSGTSLLLTDSVVVHNTAGQGGGIGVGSSGVATLWNSTVRGNVADQGGGIDVNTALLSVTGTTVTANSASYGGGIQNLGGSATLTRSSVQDNTAQWGGGVFNMGAYTDDGVYGPLTLNRTTISNNTAGSGGAIFNLNGTVAANDSTISNNVVVGYGGGLWNSAIGSITLGGNAIVTGNSAGDAGGGIYNIPGGTLVNCIVGVNVTGNTPDDISPAPGGPGGPGGGGGTPGPSGP